MATLKIDAEFKNLIPPLSPEEYKQLEENIISDGCRDALVVWDGTVIDGHNRYEICQKRNIPFRTIEKHFETRNDAMQWIILNQFGRRNLSPGNRSLLALKLEPIFKAKAAENLKASGEGFGKGMQKSADPIKPIETRKEVAKLAGVSHDTIDKVKKIVDLGTPEQVERIKRGNKGNTVNAVFKEVQQKVKPQSTPAPPKEPEKEPTTADIIRTIKDPDAAPEFTIENLVDEIEVNADEYVHALKNSIVTRSTLLSTAENREQIIKALNGIKSKIERLKEIIK